MIFFIQFVKWKTAVFSSGMFFFIFREYRDIIKKSNLGEGLGGILGDSLGAKKRHQFSLHTYSSSAHLYILSWVTLASLVINFPAL